MKRKMTLRISIFLFFYLFTAFFLLGIAARVITGFIDSGEIYLLQGELVKSAKMSFVAGALGTLVSFIFNKIDEYYARKKPPTDPDK